MFKPLELRKYARAARLFAATADAHIEDVDDFGADINEQLVADGAELHLGDWLLGEMTTDGLCF